MSLLASCQVYAVQEKSDNTTPAEFQWTALQTYFHIQGFNMVNVDKCSSLHKQLSSEPKYKSTCEKSFFKSNKTFDKNSILNFRVSVYKFRDKKKAKHTYDQLFLSADINTGLTYAWDYVLLKGNELYWLHAGCYFSEKNWTKIYSKLKEYLSQYSSRHSQNNSFQCRCGFGCLG